jgi:AbrB family looped-hinge helix DNA binding protein
MTLRQEIATTTVSEKGQITIPQGLRRRLNIQPGDILEIVEDRGVLVASKRRVRDPLDAVFGILELEEAVDDFVEEIRGPAR